MMNEVPIPASWWQEKLEEFVSKHSLAVNALTEKQMAAVIRQALACGDLMRHVMVGNNPTFAGHAQQVTYIPYRREEELLYRIGELEEQIRNHQPQENEMEPHEKRVVIEKSELDEKRYALHKFIQENPLFKTLSKDNRIRLDRQLEAMNIYSQILSERIDNFPGSDRATDKKPYECWIAFYAQGERRVFDAPPATHETVAIKHMREVLP